MNKNVIIALLAVILVGGGLWYLANRPADVTPSADTVMTEPVVTDTVPAAGVTSPTEGVTAGSSPAAMSELAAVTVEMAEFKFAPASMTVKKGETVKLLLKNSGKMPHDFVIDELDVKSKVVSPGAEDSVEFTPDTAGTYEYYCSVGQHRANGMVGTLTVTE